MQVMNIMNQTIRNIGLYSILRKVQVVNYILLCDIFNCL